MSGNLDRYKRRTFQIVFVLIGSIFLIKLFYIQVLDPTYAVNALNNVRQEVVKHPSRGLIYDRNGKLLVYNDAVYDVMVVPRDVGDIDSVELCNILGITLEDYTKRLSKARRYSSRKPSVFEKNMTSRTYAALHEKLFSFPGFFVESRTDRRYEFRGAPHVLGYIGEVTPKQTEANPYYRSGDFIGISGIEKAYEEILRGKKGVEYVLVDVFNRKQGKFMDGKYDTMPISGQDLTTGLDVELQEYGEKLLNGKIGSIVAIEPATGEILAMVSTPDYDPNLFVGRERGNNYMKLLNDPRKPLYNRAIKAPYPPGSTFKTLQGLIGLQEGVITPASRFPCHGGYHLGSLKVGCHAHASGLDLRQSIQQSCNAYYCHVFRNVVDMRKFPTTAAGFDNWYKHVQSFGIGTVLETDLASVGKGWLPSVEKYNRIYGEGRWKSSTIISLSIGQGEVGLTPLQLANMCAAIANRGFWITPHVIKGIGADRTIPEKYTEKHRTTIEPRYFQPVIEGMRMVMTSGTGRWANIDSLDMCGKTGTAQNPHGKDHSVFICFAPMDNPKIAIAVTVENGGFGATWAGPIACLMVEKYLTRREVSSKPAMEEKMLNGVLVKESETTQ